MAIDPRPPRPLFVLETGQSSLIPTALAIWRLGTPSAANKMIRARFAARCVLVWARTRRSNSTRCL